MLQTKNPDAIGVPPGPPGPPACAAGAGGPAVRPAARRRR